ncbi:MULTISPECIES: RapH N-terminal domain-containing protein [Bacillus]|uniref:response regulator aspartate phosphatase n=1 Tax=Bacillus TaxID=1386 RepID=UPI00046A9A91|nr:MULTISPECIES: RapH N-terminal domain-containing protein [Bacillus]MED1412476.1 RapH N-terminal domain-containing protein [Bacillus paramycoides]MED1464225.1 RapH N-terminal domain-containing protein [Bacillus paramycoides]MED1495229.1 RapH N-terminal domain-containing protein [Bacillus paramycoides]
MNVQIQGNEQISSLLNDWYQTILRLQNMQATNLKQEVEDKLDIIKEDENLLLYYSLLDFRYKVLTDGLSITKVSFNEINSFDIPDNSLLSYYYHFFKAIHSTILTDYNEAKEHFEKAEKLLFYTLSELEKAEFNYRFASFYYQIYKPFLAIDHIRVARNYFSKHTDYDINVALCDNVFGLSCIDLRQFEQAEESFTAAIDILKNKNEETLLLRVRNNIGLLYANQNLSSLAIRHLSEVTENIPNHFKALFLQADEHLKLGETAVASHLIEKGLAICNELENIEYQYRFKILERMNNSSNTTELEAAVLAGISYFKKEELWDCIEEYAERLANKFYVEENHAKASKYFYMSNEARKKILAKGALK